VVWRDQTNPAGCTKFCTPIVHFDGAILDREDGLCAKKNFPSCRFRVSSLDV